MNTDREGLTKDLSELPVPFVAALTLRAAMRAIPIFGIVQGQVDGTTIASSLTAFDIKTYKKFRGFPTSLLPNWFAKRSIQKEAVIAKRLHDNAKMLWIFHSSQTALFASWFVSSSADKDDVVVNGPHYAANATHAAVLLGLLGTDEQQSARAIAAATAAASGTATAAALLAAGAPTPGNRTPAEAAASAASAAVGVSENRANAVELAADAASLRFGNAGPFGNNVASAELKQDAARILSAPLWPRGMPIEVEAMWRRLRSDMLDLKAGFEIWIEWYERRLWGVPPSMALEKSWATLPNAWLDVDPADINAYLQSLAKGGPAKEPPDSLKTAAARNKERAAGYLKLLPFVKRDPKFAESLAETERKNKAHFRQNWWDAIKAALDWRGLPFLILATYGAVAFISRTFGVPAHDPPLSEVYSGYEWLRDWIFAPLVAITSFVQLGFPIWLKDLTFVYLRIGSSLRSTLMTAYFPSKKPRRLLDFFKGKAERSELIASAVASLMWPWHFFGFAIVRVDPVKAYYDTNPSIFQIFAPASDIVRPGVFNRLIAFFTVNILTIVLLTCAYFTLNAFLAV